MARRSMGSSGGGGSSRSSFSSSSGGSRSSFSSSSSYSSGSSGRSWSSGSRHHHYHYGGYGYGPSIKVSGKVVLIMFIAFFMFVGFVFIGVMGSSVSNYNQLVSIKKQDYQFYTNMIRRAEQFPDYKTTAIVTDVCYDTEVDSYYFEYSVTYEYEYYDYLDREYVTKTDTLDHSTFACYEYEEVANLKGTTIEVALDCAKSLIDYDTDTMPMSFVNTSLNDDGEYRILAGERTKLVIIQIVLILAEVGAVVGIVFIAKKKKSTSSDSSLSTDDASSETSSTPKPTQYYCDYCGAASTESAKKCSTCGASLKRK